MLRDVIGAGADGPAAILIIISTVIINIDDYKKYGNSYGSRDSAATRLPRATIKNKNKIKIKNHNHLLILILPSLFNQLRLVRKLKAF